MINPVFDSIAKKHGITATEAEALMGEALSSAGEQISPTEFLYALSEVLLSNDNKPPV